MVGLPRPPRALPRSAESQPIQCVDYLSATIGGRFGEQAMPNQNKGQGDRQPNQGNDRRQDQQRSPSRQQEQQGDKSRQQGEMDRDRDPYRSDR
jgi:hypothetical protein